jgi:GntR family transcriptional regulator
MAHYRLELGPVPLHHQVYLHLKSSLDSGELKVGDRVPAERELADRYGCSVITVRRALDELAREQRIQRTRGRGTFVLPARMDRDFAGTMSFAEEMRLRGLAPETRLVAAWAEAAGEAAATALELPLGAPIVTITRLRLADAVPLLLEEASLPAERFSGLLEQDLENQSLYEILATRYGARVMRAREALEPVLLRAREARLLEVPPGRPALLVEGVAYVANGTPVEFSRSHVRGDRTRYYVERVVARESWQRSAQRTPAFATSGGRDGTSQGQPPER